MSRGHSGAGWDDKGRRMPKTPYTLNTEFVRFIGKFQLISLMSKIQFSYAV